MKPENKCYFEGVTNGNQRRVLRCMTQPLTAKQLSQKLHLSLDQCSRALAKLTSHGLARCLNPNATRSFLFWLTRTGKQRQRVLLSESSILHDVPSIDWELYASICFGQRSEVVRSLAFAMQPATLKRRARFRTPGLRMSANNVRDVMRYLKKHKIVRAVPLKKRAHPGYALTEMGQHMRRLLMQAEVQE